MKPSNTSVRCACSTSDPVYIQNHDEEWGVSLHDDQKWMNYFTKVLSWFASTKGLRLTVTFEGEQSDGISQAKGEETRGTLKELGRSIMPKPRPIVVSVCFDHSRGCPKNKNDGIMKHLRRAREG